jgi:hypothetical protein
LWDLADAGLPTQAFTEIFKILYLIPKNAALPAPNAQVSCERVKSPDVPYSTAIIKICTRASSKGELKLCSRNS